MPSEPNRLAWSSGKQEEKRYLSVLDSGERMEIREIWEFQDGGVAFYFCKPTFRMGKKINLLGPLGKTLRPDEVRLEKP